MTAVLCALGAAISNAIATVMQRRAARRLPPGDTMRLVLVKHLLRQPDWYVGVLGMIGGFLLQALALSLAGLALVQPVIAVELPITLLIGARVFRHRVDPEAMLGMLCVSGGLALLIVATDPTGGHPPGRPWPWVWASAASIAIGGSLVAAGLATRGSPRAALFGCASGLGFGFTAALMKGSLDRLPAGWLAVATSWQLYAMVATGILSVYLTQNTLQSGPLIAGQPAITTCDPLAGILYGVFLFDESLRAGPWLIPAVLGGCLLVAGSVLLSRSPLATAGARRSEGVSAQL